MREWKIDALITEIHETLYKLGVKGTISGFFEATCAVFLVMQRLNRERFSIMSVYRRISELYHVEFDSIDPRIRRLIHRIWKSNPTLLKEMAGRDLEKAPTPREFINILCDYLSKSEDS